MQLAEIQTRIAAGEDSTTQFKQDITEADRLAEELAAFSNAEGGILFIGIADNGEVTGLSDQQVNRLNQLVSNAANENIKPPIYPLTETLNLNGKHVMIVNVRKGGSRPYQTNKGIYLTKSGNDKRKMSPEELRRLFAESSRLFADEELLFNSKQADLNTQTFYEFLQKDNALAWDDLENGKLELTTILENLELLRDGHLTLAGNLIFGKLPQKHSPSFYVDCVHFHGNDIAGLDFIAKTTVKGTLSSQFENTMNFIRSNLRRVPLTEGFNAQTRLEMDELAISELLVNALVHRDYYIQSSIKIFIFNDRLEIISPGKLPNSLTVAKVKNGLAIHRNPILNSICKNVLPYSGYGSGIKRAFSLCPELELVNDTEQEAFRCILPRQVFPA